MSDPRNILFIMCDQLRWDYLSCYGHPHLQTPNIDRLAQYGVRFENAFVQSPLCGPSRSCMYTGRYLFSHGAMVNAAPLRIDERLLGDYLHEVGLEMAVIGKTHMAPNLADLKDLDIDLDSEKGHRLINSSFDPVWHDDGLHPDPITPPDLRYNQWLRHLGYDNENPWDRNANGALDNDGNFLSGWQMRHANLPANIAEEHSETAYATECALNYIQRMGDQPWALHLSYIKPHWPYIAPAPYHNIYGPDDLLPAICSETERKNPHPVYAAFMDEPVSQNFSRQEVRERVIPTYMGLIKQIDDHLGRIWDLLEQSGRMDDTLIVFTSDHGDYLGDHWLGEKYLFHDASVRVPLIIYDPSSEAEESRGTTNQELVESIDLLPTFIEALGGTVAKERLEGRSLLPILQGHAISERRKMVISEIDYTDCGVRQRLGLSPTDCHATMIRTHDWLYIYHEAFRPQLFDLQTDPHQLVDLGSEPDHQTTCQEMRDYLFYWMRQRRQQITMTSDQLQKLSPKADERLGILIGHW